MNNEFSLPIREMSGASNCVSEASSKLNLESLHSIATMVAQERDLDRVLETVVQSLVQRWNLALARIWLIGPGDICGSCFLSTECPDQRSCLHLVASASRPTNPDSGDEWYKEGGFYRRLPLGVRRIGSIAATGELVRLSDTERDGDWFARNDWLRRENVQSFCGYPLKFRNEILGVLAVFSRSRVEEQQCNWLHAFADSAAVAIANARAFEEIEDLKDQLELENEYLRDEIRNAHAVGGIIGESLGLQKVLEQVKLVAAADSSVLVLGESGVGKELIARAIHEQSPRAERPLVKVNCASIPHDLFESEFFGHVKGSFTGATRNRAGRFELADAGTLFLDEVGEIPLELQGKLLRVLQEGSYERIGDEQSRSVDVRIVAATNRDLQEEVEGKRFRQDLFYRLSVFPIEVPPLRDRRDDIPRLAIHFLDQYSRKLGISAPKLRQRHIIELQQYSWPGNIRELQNVVERAVISGRKGHLEFHLPQSTRTGNENIEMSPIRSAKDLMTDEEMRLFERQNLTAVLKHHNWKISGEGGAAEYLGLHPATLSSRMRAMGVERPR